MFEGHEFNSKSETHDVFLKAQYLLEEKKAEMEARFVAENGHKPTATDEEKMLKGIELLLRMDYDQTESPAERAVLEKAFEFIQSDMKNADIRKTFEELDRRNSPR